MGLKSVNLGRSVGSYGPEQKGTLQQRSAGTAGSQMVTGCSVRNALQGNMVDPEGGGTMGYVPGVKDPCYSPFIKTNQGVSFITIGPAVNSEAGVVQQRSTSLVNSYVQHQLNSTAQNLHESQAKVAVTPAQSWAL